MSNLDQYDKFNFYTRYRWTATDFENFEQTIYFLSSALARRNPEAVVRGFSFQSAVGLAVTVAGGLAIDVNGFPLHKSSASPVNTEGPSLTFGRWNLIVARKKSTNINNITDPNNPTNTVPLNTREECEIVSISGALAGSPSYPSKVAGDVILFGIRFTAGQTTVTTAEIDYSVTEYPFKSSDDGNYLKIFDAVVGSGRFSTHKTINDVMSDPNIANIKDILVSEGFTVNTVQNINQANKRFVFKSGSTVLKGTATTGLLVSAAGVILENVRVEDFNGVGDAPIAFATGADYGVVNMCRLKDSNDIVDQTVNGINVVALSVEA